MSEDNTQPIVAPSTVAPVTEEKKSSIVGKTLKEFDGVNLGTLRAWERYWMNDKRHKGDKAITAERPVAKHLELIRAEIKARGK